MADEESHPDFGISGPSPTDDACRLRKQAAVSALDEVLKAIDKDLTLLENRPPSEDERGLPQTITAVNLAVEHEGPVV